MRLESLTDAVGIHLLRFAVMWAVLETSPLLGITNWYRRLAVDVVFSRGPGPSHRRYRLLIDSRKHFG